MTSAGITEKEARDVEARISNAVYLACAPLLESLEGAGKIRANGHHLAQTIAAKAVELVHARWQSGDIHIASYPATNGRRAMCGEAISSWTELSMTLAAAEVLAKHGSSTVCQICRSKYLELGLFEKV